MSGLPAPPHILAAAERDYQVTRQALAGLIQTTRELLAEFPTEVEAVAELWLILLGHDRRTAAMLAATAIIQLTNNQPPTPSTASGPGS